MARFEDAIDYVLANEGGLEVNDADAGGTTNFGLAQRDHPDVDVRALTRDQAVELYRTGYWRFDGVRDQRVATKLFDEYVNGPVRAVRCAQLALAHLQAGPVVPDGKYGRQTEDHLNASDPGKFVDEYKAWLVKTRHDEVAAKPDQQVFLLGWLRRDVKG
jgi:lysozyme family protein